MTRKARMYSLLALDALSYYDICIICTECVMTIFLCFNWIFHCNSLPFTIIFGTNHVTHVKWVRSNAASIMPHNLFSNLVVPNGFFSGKMVAKHLNSKIDMRIKLISFMYFKIIDFNYCIQNALKVRFI